jgi:hypothetical protein
MSCAIAKALTTGGERTAGYVGFSLRRKLLPFGNFYADKLISVHHSVHHKVRSRDSAKATIFHSIEECAWIGRVVDHRWVFSLTVSGDRGWAKRFCSVIIQNTQFCHDAPVAQLDRVLGYEPRGWEFDSLRAHHFSPTCTAEGAPNTRPKNQVQHRVFTVLVTCLKASEAGSIRSKWPACGISSNSANSPAFFFCMT